MKRVFILQKPRRDDLELDVLRKHSTDDAYHKLIADDEARPSFASTEFAQMILQNAKQVDFNPEVDLFAIVGSIAPVAIAVGALTEEYGPLNLLVFSASESDYIPVDLERINYVT